MFIHCGLFVLCCPFMVGGWFYAVHRGLVLCCLFIMGCSVLAIHLWVGCFVLSIHHGLVVLCCSQLRVLYECNPMAFIMEQAGGKASDGHKRILDIQPKNIHERSPIFMGSKEEVEEVEALYKKHAK